MDWLVLAGGMLARLALPVGLPLVLGGLLRRLDARWQAEATGAPRREASLGTPCWVTQQCSPARGATCPAYGQHNTACWQFFRDASGNLRADCLRCAVLKQAPAFVST